MISKFQKLLLILQMFHFDDILLFFHGCNSFSYFSDKYTTYFYFFLPPAPHASLKVCFFFIVFLYLPLKLVNFLNCLWRSDFWYIFIIY